MGKKTQKTPKGHEIPVPTKEEFETALDKEAKPVKESPPRRPKKQLLELRLPVVPLGVPPSIIVQVTLKMLSGHRVVHPF
jgi:hypothetical protein